MLNKLPLLLLTLLISSEALAEPFKVGVILPLSGPVAEFGKASTNGASLFEEDFPDNNLQVFYEDSRYDGPTSISAYNKLNDIDKVDIVYVWGTGPCAVVSPIAEFKKVPVLLMTGDANDVIGKKYSVCFSNKLEDYSQIQLEELRRRGKKKIAIVKTEIQFLETLIKGMKDNLKPDESIEIIESFPPGQNVNFQSALTKLKLRLKKGQYDALGVVLIAGQLSSFYRKMKDLNVKVETFSTDFLDSSDERRQAGASLVGATFPALGVKDTFLKKYEAKFNTADIVGFAAGFYDLLSLLNDLFSEPYKDNKKLSSEDILNRIESVTEREGASGKYYFTRDDPEHDPVGGKRFKFPIVIKEVTEGGRERVIP